MRAAPRARPRRTAGATAAAGAALLAAGVRERHRPVLRRVELPLLAAPGPPLRVLHLTDLHTTPRQRVLPDWVADLGRLVPDLVVVTGDLLGAEGAVPAVLHALDPLLTRPGVFVPGNNDDTAPTPPNPLRYLRPGPHEPPPGARPLPWPDLARALVDRGWTDATHRRTTLRVGGRTVEVLGLDDPTRRRDRPELLPGRPADAEEPDVTLGLVHTPEPSAVDALVQRGAALVLAGHTHGGQVRLPGIGPITTNCHLPRAYGRGLSPWPPGLLHVSAGVGTSPYVPVRLGCPPEATLLTLVPRAAPVPT